MDSSDVIKQWDNFANKCIAGELGNDEVKAMYERDAHGYDEFATSRGSDQ